VKPHGYTSEGIVLARKNYGEADRIIWIFSKSQGRIALIAKGVRRPKSKKRGHLEVFSRINFGAVKGRGMDLLLEAEAIDDFKQIRVSLKKISLAYYFCEVIGRITHEGEPNERLFDLILTNFEKLKSAKLLKKLRLDFITKLLILQGYWPQDKVLADPDQKLEEVIERQIASKRVGKRMIQ
jgi:DNA repair protein RecO (recombination protein O)